MTRRSGSEAADFVNQHVGSTEVRAFLVMLGPDRTPIGSSLGSFCSIQHNSTFRLKCWTNPGLVGKGFCFWRGGCGRGAHRPPAESER